MSPLDCTKVSSVYQKICMIHVYLVMHGINWKSNIILTSTMIPGILFFVFFITNTILWVKGSSGKFKRLCTADCCYLAAVPFGTLVALLSLWLFISVPLSFVGSFFGFKAPAVQAPVRTNQIPRQVPEQTLYTKPLPGNSSYLKRHSN